MIVDERRRDWRRWWYLQQLTLRRLRKRPGLPDQKQHDRFQIAASAYCYLSSVRANLVIVNALCIQLWTTLGQNGVMPHITQPDDAEWSPEIEAAVATFGNRARNEILRYLAHHSPATRGDIVAAVSSEAPSVAKHLIILEETGVITADREPGQRHGRAPRYSTNKARIRELMAAHRRYLLDQ